MCTIRPDTAATVRGITLRREGDLRRAPATQSRKPRAPPRSANGWTLWPATIHCSMSTASARATVPRRSCTASTFGSAPDNSSASSDRTGRANPRCSTRFSGSPTFTRGESRSVARNVTRLGPNAKLRDAGIAYVLHDSSLFPDMTVEQNLWLGGYLRGRSSDARHATEGVFDRYPALASPPQRTGKGALGR